MNSAPAIRNSSRLIRLPGFDYVRVQDGELMFSPVTLRHIAPDERAALDFRWKRYGAGIEAPPGPQRDLRIAKSSC